MILGIVLGMFLLVYLLGHGAGIYLIVRGSTYIIDNIHFKNDIDVINANCTLQSITATFSPQRVNKGKVTSPASATCLGDIAVFPLSNDFEKNSNCMFAGERGCDCSVDDDQGCMDSLICTNGTCESKTKRIGNKILCAKFEREVKGLGSWDMDEGKSKAIETCPKYLPNASFSCYYAEGLYSTCGSSERIFSDLDFDKQTESVFTSEKSLRDAVTGGIDVGIWTLVGGFLLEGFLCLPCWCCFREKMHEYFSKFFDLTKLRRRRPGDYQI